MGGIGFGRRLGNEEMDDLFGVGCGGGNVDWFVGKCVNSLNKIRDRWGVLFEGGKKEGVELRVWWV